MLDDHLYDHLLHNLYIVDISKTLGKCEEAFHNFQHTLSQKTYTFSENNNKIGQNVEGYRNQCFFSY